MLVTCGYPVDNLGWGWAGWQGGYYPYIYKTHTFHKLFKCQPVAREHKKSNIIINYYTA